MSKLENTPAVCGAGIDEQTSEDANSKALLLMVSGGSDSMAMLEKFHDRPNCKVLHINHMLRGKESDGDEQFVRDACKRLNVPLEVRRIDVAALAAQGKSGMEAAAREARYKCADEVLDAWCAHLKLDPDNGIIYTAHTLDDRVETFFMRALVGTGPGGFASIPRVRGRIERPLLDETREGLRNFLREQYPNTPDIKLWREDSTNEDGSNFRSKIRTKLMPVLRELRPNFEPALARSMDLIAQEDEAQDAQAMRILLLNVQLKDSAVQLPCKIFNEISVPLARRIIRKALLLVNDEARLESKQIERILQNYSKQNFCTEVDSGIKVKSDGTTLIMHK